MIPQPGVVADIANRDKATALDNVVDMNALKSSMVPGTLEAGTVNGKLYGLLVSVNVKSLVFYPKKAWDEAGYKAPTDHRRARRPDRQDQGRQARRPLVHRHRVRRRPPAGRPRTGSRTSSCATAAPTDTTSGSSTRSSSTPRCVRQAAAEFEKIAFTAGNVLGGRKSIASTNFGTAGNPMFDAKPGCMLCQAGQLHHRVLPQGRAGGPRQPTSASSASRRRRRAARTRSSAAVTWPSLLKDNAGASRGHEDARRHRASARRPCGTSFLSPHKDFDTSLYPSELAQQVAEAHIRLVDLPLRRLRPDARRRRGGHLLEGHDRLDQRPGGAGHRPEEHRRELAQLSQ